MDQTLKTSKRFLDDAESDYKKRGTEKSKEDTLVKLLRYYLDGNDPSGINELKQLSRNPNDSSDDESNTKKVNGKEIIDSSDDEEEQNEKGKGRTNEKKTESNFTLGDKVIDLWNKRKSKLSHDVAIAGWLLSPDTAIRNDVNSKEAHHVIAVENLLKQWLKTKVLKLYNFFFVRCDYHLT